jgi:hypothetical protein
MAKANLTLPNGTTVAIEGTAEEVSALLARVSASPPSVGRPRSNRGKKKAGASGQATSPHRKGPQAFKRGKGERGKGYAEGVE